MTFQVRRLGPPVDDPAGFAAFANLYRADQALRDPDDPPVSDRQIMAESFDPHPRKQRFAWLATDGDSPVGIGWAGTESDPDDEFQLVSVEFVVDAAQRRRGAANAMLRAAVPALIEAGQNSLCAYPCGDIEPDAARALCERYGLTKRSEERCSRALVADVDEQMMDVWITAAASSAAGYRIEQWEGFVPDHLAAAWCQAEAGMDDAPLDDFEYHRDQLDAEARHCNDEVMKSGGFRVYRTLALALDGAPAGMSALYVHQDRPEVGYQADTAVLAAHRGHRLGRWLKAANYRLTHSAHPDLMVIETYNAQSNPWMLDINVAMGFRPHHYYDLYQNSLDDVAVRLSLTSDP